MLVLGIIVITLIGFLLYTTFFSGSETVTMQTCKAALISVCNECKLKDWSGTVTISYNICPKNWLETGKIQGFQDFPNGDDNIAACSLIQNGCQQNFGVS